MGGTDVGLFWAATSTLMRKAFLRSGKIMWRRVIGFAKIFHR
jgi:hypothetical protein